MNLFVRKSRSGLFALTCLFLVAACGIATTAFELGTLDVLVQDQAGNGVNGARVELLSSRGDPRDVQITPFPGAGGAGAARFIVAPDQYQLRVTPPDGYTVPSTQINPVPASVRNGRLTEIQFRLQATAGASAEASREDLD